MGLYVLCMALCGAFVVPVSGWVISCFSGCVCAFFCFDTPHFYISEIFFQLFFGLLIRGNVINCG